MEFSQLTLLLVVAGVFGLVAKQLRQPLLVGYLFAGFFLASIGVVGESQGLSNLGNIGVTLLLFLLGLEMNLKEISSIGKVALITGIGQIVFTSSIGFLIASLLGFSSLNSIYIATALTFSSTIIMVKLLSEKKDLSSLYGKIAIGFLLVQDFVAIFILMFLAGLRRGNQTSLEYLIMLFKAVLLISVVWVLSKKILPRLFDKYIASSPELLFIISIAWALGVASFVAGPMGFTLEIGGFLAGLALSNLGEHLQIASRTKPLRDFFLTIFFLYLGTQLVVEGGVSEIIIPGMILSIFVLIGNPIIVLSIMGLLGYKRRTSFMAGLTVAQISEFSLILMAMGSSLGHVGDKEVALVVFVGVVTMTISTYMILGADSLYKKLYSFLRIFERSKVKEKAYAWDMKMKEHVVLVGCDRAGKAISKYLSRKEIPYVIVDFDPGVFTKMTAENYPVIFGDIADHEIMEAANLNVSSFVISTTSNIEDNLVLLEYLSKLVKKPVGVFTAQLRNEAIRLYEKGADYVIVPEMVAGEHIRHLLINYGLNRKKITKIGKNHFNRLIYI